MTVTPVMAKSVIEVSAVRLCSSVTVPPMSFGLQRSRHDHVEHWLAGMCPHAVAPHNLQLLRDDQVHGDEGVFVVSNHQAHLNLATALAEAEHGVAAGLSAPQGVDSDVCATPGQIVDRLDDVRCLPGIDHAVGTHGLCQVQGCILDVDADHLGAHRVGDHDRREADATTAVHDEPLAGRGSALYNDGAERGDEATAEARRVDEAEPLGSATRLTSAWGIATYSANEPHAVKPG